MEINIKGNQTYRNDNGEIVSKEQYDSEFLKFKVDFINAYNNKANQIINRINSTASSDIDKLWMLYDYLTSETMIYDLQGRSSDGKMAAH